MNSMTLPARFKTNDKGTFGEHTAKVRWPIIVQNAIDDMSIALEGKDGATLKEGNKIKDELAGLREEVINNAVLREFTSEETEVASVPSSFNEYLRAQGQEIRWRSSEWLFSEVYLYRRINVFFQFQPLWKKFDIFDRLKQSTFESSLYGVVELALRYKNLRTELTKASKDKEFLQILFKEFIDISLWGNATDLSLLTDATIEDIKSIQGAKARQESESKILVNDTLKAWDTLEVKSSVNAGEIRVDFVLDNSGFELYADLMLAAFLLHSKLATKCIFHAKDIPYMVSDVMLKDFDTLIKDLKDRKFFPVKDKKSQDALDLFADDISNFVANGKLEFREDSFWTTELDYWNLNDTETKYHGATIYEDLLHSDLVIFKGDLNYRKLTGDRKWERTTSWAEAIGALAKGGITLLSLRTCKADVQVDLPQGVDEKLCELWEKEHPGQGSWWCSSGKWAVICFSSSEK